jgi:hypothetical protein
MKVLIRANPCKSVFKKGTSMLKLKLLLASRKFWAALIGLLAIVLRSYVPNFPIAEEQLVAVVVIIVGYILGTAIEDTANTTIKR